MTKTELPDKFIVKMDESKVSKKILPILRKGLDFRKHPYCATFSMMQGECYRGTWGNGSFRFLHCVCKMIDDGTRKVGTTMVSVHRAMKGWGTCDEGLWPSNVDLDVAEFEDWKRIPKEACDDARRKRTQNNKLMASSWPSEVLNTDGRVFRLFTFMTDIGRILGGEDRQLELLVIDSGFDTLAWATLRAYVKGNQMTIEDLFVKPEFRRSHLGTTLLHRIEQTACLEKPFSELNGEILVPISKPDAGPTRYNAARDFFMKNRYAWKNTDPIRKYVDWSIFTATKKLDCGEIIKE